MLGSFSLRVEGREAKRLPRKTRALLAYLGVSAPAPAPRDELAELIWSGVGIQQARQSLRQALLMFRRDVELSDRVLAATADGLALQPSVDTDLRLVGQASSGAAFSERAAAAALCTEPLLAGFPSIGPAFDDWLRLARDRTGERMLDILARLAEDQEALGDHDGAVRTAERMLRHDDLREDLHRRLILAYARAGRPADAVRQVEVCTSILRRELDVEPSAQTLGLAKALRDGGSGTAPAVDGRRSPPAMPAQPRNGPPWIAVLPFRSLAEDAAQPYLAHGVADDIVRLLATMQEPVVVSLHASRAYAGPDTDLRRIGRELGVQYVLSGSVRCGAGRTRIACELADAETAVVLWSTTDDVAGLDLFTAVDAAVARIVRTLVRRVEEFELRRLRSTRPDQLGAYDLTLRGREHVRSLDRTRFDLAEPLLRRAVDADPCYSAAHLALAEWHNFRIGQGWSGHRERDSADLLSAVKVAIGLDRRNARALALLGHAQVAWQRDYDAALPTFDRALAVAPNESVAWSFSSPAYTWLGDGDEALRRAERALRLSPEDPFLFWIYHCLALACFTLQRPEEAARWGLLARAENPRFTANLRTTAAALIQIGDRRRAGELVRETLAVDPTFRVRRSIDRVPWRDEWRRRLYGERLIEAGFPA